MQFLTAQQELAQRLGIDLNDITVATRIKFWLNLSRKDIEGYYDWEWLKSVETLSLSADYSTGTASVNAGATSVTFSSGPATSQTGRYIQFSGANDWYKITAHVAGETTATISPAYAKTTNLASGTFNIRTFYYSLSSSTEKVFSCRQATSPRYVSIIDSTIYDSQVPFTTSTGETKSIIMWGYDSSGNIQFTPYPFPDSAYLLEFRTIKKTADLTATTDAPLFPQRFDSVWLAGAEYHGYKLLHNVEMMDRARKEFTDKIEELVSKDNTGLSRMRVIQGIDGGSGNPIVPFPDRFGAKE